MDIYNANEIGLFYLVTPDGSLCYKHETLNGSKTAMDRITVLCCCNMSDTDKKKLVVICKSAKPRYFENIKITNLPVSYLMNKTMHG